MILKQTTAIVLSFCIFLFSCSEENIVPQKQEEDIKNQKTIDEIHFDDLETMLTANTGDLEIGSSVRVTEQYMAGSFEVGALGAFGNEDQPFVYNGDNYQFRRILLDGSSVAVEWFGAKDREQSGTQIQAAFDSYFQYEEVKGVKSITKSVFYVNSELKLWYQHEGITLDFDESWITLHEQQRNLIGILTVYLGDYNNSGNHPKQWGFDITKINIDGSMGCDEVYYDANGIIDINKFTNGILVKHGGDETNVLKDCNFGELNLKNIGASGILFNRPGINITIDEINANKIGSHSFGCTLISGEHETTHQIDGQNCTFHIKKINASESGTIFDFSQQDKDSPAIVGYATVDEAIGYDMFGRTKVHGNWGLHVKKFSSRNVMPHKKKTDDGGGLYFDKTAFWSAFEVANAKVQDIIIDKLIVKNAPAGAFRFTPNPAIREGSVTIHHAEIEDCYRGIRGGLITVNYLKALRTPIFYLGNRLKEFHCEDANLEYWVDKIESDYKNQDHYKVHIQQYPLLNLYNQPNLAVHIGNSETKSTIKNMGSLKHGTNTYVNSLFFASNGSHATFENIEVIEEDSSVEYALAKSQGGTVEFIDITLPENIILGGVLH